MDWENECAERGEMPARRGPLLSEGGLKGGRLSGFGRKRPQRNDRIKGVALRKSSNFDGAGARQNKEKQE